MTFSRSRYSAPLAWAWALAAVGSAPLTAAQTATPARESAQPGPAQSEARSVAGQWLMIGYKGSAGYPPAERVLLTSDGKWPPLLPQAKALMEQRLRDSEEGHPFANTVALCLPGGMPQMLFNGGEGFKIVDAPGEEIFLYQEQNNFRIVAMNQPHSKDPDLSYMGEGVGHWDGDTLVVDTIGLRENTTLDQIGMPHSDALHLIERYRRTAPDRMEVVVTIDDPKTYSRPWETKATYRLAPKNMTLNEYICENNRNAPDASGHQGFQFPRP